METIELEIEPRCGAGKGAARAMRRRGKVPCILYGAKRSATLVTVDARLPRSFCMTRAGRRPPCSLP